MIDVIECPHCYTRVSPKMDNTCPACGKNTRDKTNANPNLTTAALFPTTSVPSNCVVCGQQTNRFFKYKIEVPGDQDTKLISTLLSMLSGKLLSVLFGVKKNMQSIGVKLPVCKNCKKSQSNIKPIHFDRDTDAMTFVVHKAFKEGLQQLNKNR